MKCPFLEEVVVRYCKASPIKKMIPTPNIVSDDPCVGCPEKCVTYQEAADLKVEQSLTKSSDLDSKLGQTKEVIVNEAKQKVKECIWMKAGVIAYRLCTSNYDCKNCAFDQMLTDTSGVVADSPLMKEAIEKLRKMPPEKRKCRYMLTGDISFKLCANNYECWHCPVDQMISDLVTSHPLLVKKRAKREERVEAVRGFAFHPKAAYLPNHIWIRIDKDDQIKVGIDDFAVKLLADFDQVVRIETGERLNDISFKKANKIVKLPIKSLGRVKKINEEAFNKPEIIRNDPYEKGWLFTLENENITDTLKELLKGDNARKWLEKEFENLKATIQQECEITIADGGELVEDFRKRLSEELNHKLIQKFLTERKEQ